MSTFATRTDEEMSHPHTNAQPLPLMGACACWKCFCGMLRGSMAQWPPHVNGADYSPTSRIVPFDPHASSVRLFVISPKPARPFPAHPGHWVKRLQMSRMFAYGR